MTAQAAPSLSSSGPPATGVGRPGAGFGPDHDRLALQVQGHLADQVVEIGLVDAEHGYSPAPADGLHVAGQSARTADDGARRHDRFVQSRLQRRGDEDGPLQWASRAVTSASQHTLRATGQQESLNSSPVQLILQVLGVRYPQLSAQLPRGHRDVGEPFDGGPVDQDPHQAVTQGGIH